MSDFFRTTILLPHAQPSEIQLENKRTHWIRYISNLLATIAAEQSTKQTHNSLPPLSYAGRRKWGRFDCKKFHYTCSGVVCHFPTVFPAPRRLTANVYKKITRNRWHQLKQAVPFLWRTFRFSEKVDIYVLLTDNEHVFSVAMAATNRFRLAQCKRKCF